jgi:hypothetical protein
MHIGNRRLAAASAIAAVAALAVAPQPASASSHQPCTIVKHGNTKGVTKIGAATATVGADGIKLTTGTSSDADKVSWQDSIKPVPANTITELSYETIKLDSAGPNVNDAALPAYHVYVKTPQGAGTLVYEPYWGLGNSNPPRGLRIEWDVLKGKLWTPSNVIVGLPKTAGGPATKTFTQVVAENPKMTVTGIGFGLGTYNRGVEAVLDEQRIATKKSCSDHQWSTGFQNGPWWPGWLRRS